MDKKWILKPRGDDELIKKLASELTVDPVIANLLIQRGLKTFKEAEKFFNPDLANLHDPFLMKNMAQAISRIEKAIENNEVIGLK